MRHTAALLLIASSLASALPDKSQARDQLPDLFEVTGVSATDTLNIRLEPGEGAPVIGALAADATNIEIIRANEDNTWGLINHGEATGWVSLAFLARPSGVPTTAGPAIRQCFGTEPFWSLAIDPPRIIYSTPEIEGREGLLSSYFRSRSRPDRYAEIGSFFPGPWGDRDIHLSLRRETCSDGMSDREYGIAVDMLITRVSVDGDDTMTGLFSGCCSLTPPPAE